MIRLFSTLERLLRGELTSRESLESRGLDVPLRLLLTLVVLLGVAYGICMGLYGATRTVNASMGQLVASAIKLPLLYVLTLAVTFPSLWVFSTLGGSRLSFKETLRLLLIGITISLTVAASFGPITGFFTLSTESYRFMIVLNVVFLAVGGFIGLVFMFRVLGIVTEPRLSSGAMPDSEMPDSAMPDRAMPVSAIPDSETASVEPDAAAESKRPEARSQARAMRAFKLASDISRQARKSSAERVFVIWVILYGAVGAQMGWILRPFIGSPSEDFTFFRPRTSNFFSAFFRSLAELLSN
jgi:hypothetical protein